MLNARETLDVEMLIVKRATQTSQVHATDPKGRLNKDYKTLIRGTLGGSSVDGDGILS